MNQNLLQYQKLNDQRLASLELKLGQICDALNEREKGKLPSQFQQNPKSTFQASTSACNESSHDQLNAVTTLRSGRVIKNNVGMPHTNGYESDSPLHITAQKTPAAENESEHVEKSKSSTNVNVSLPCHVHVAPFPQRQIPTYAKFLKDLCTQKRKLHMHKRAFLTDQVSSIIQNKIPTKLRDPGCPTITCTIGDYVVEKALLDLGASVNLLPYSVYVHLGLGELKPTPVTLQLTDRSVRIPRGIVEDVLIKVDKFFFLVDFIVLDTQPV
ncbi:uncharacterized protein LOC113345735 [Papaver somniferum]|uniref:uncharacterized protein LOC113345735 n=1 Tax=Papaver somniferum TaxID=3469 RepID=UPI000E6F522C|nr:uncharacterized protein LOC113345735 [Papaver somniferum]